MLAHMLSSCEKQVTTTKRASTLSILIQKITQLHLSSTLFKSESWSVLNCCCFWLGMASDQDQRCTLTITYSHNSLCKLKIYPRKQRRLWGKCYWAVQAGLLTPLTFAWHCSSPLAAFISVRTFFTMKGGDSEFANFTLPALKTFLEARSQNVSGNKQ